MTTPAQTPFAIETDRLTKIYGSGNTEVVAMRDATMQVRQLPEPKHIDDQIEWLDDGNILYAVGHSPSASVRRADIWRLAIDGASPPSMFLPDAESPAVVRP